MSTKYERPSGDYNGASGLSYRTKYQDDAGMVPKVAISSSKMDGDLNYVIDALNDIDDASGSKASIDERLSVSLNADGTIKGSVVASVDEWTALSASGLVRVDGSNFQLNGDETSVFTAGRRIRLTISGASVYADVASSSYSSVTTVTCVDIVDANGSTTTISTHPSAVAYSPNTVGKTGNSQTDFSDLKMRTSVPVLRMKDTGGDEFALRQNGSSLEFVENTGSEASPSWVSRGSVTSSGITLTDASVALSKLANGTDGELISWDSSGVVTTIAVGDAGDVLTSNGVGAVPAFGRLVPAGAVMPFMGSSTPTGWLLCDGSAVSRATYSALFTALGTTYGAGDGSTTFNIPDLRGRSLFGLDNMGGSDAGRLSASNTLGGFGGSETTGGTTESHILSVDEIPAHTHAVQALPSGGSTTVVQAGSSSGTPYSLDVETTSVGGGNGHTHDITDLDILPPYMLVNFIIKI